MASFAQERLGEILLRLGFSHQEQINEALELQKLRPKRIGEVLMDLGYNDEDHVLQALSDQFDVPFDAELEKSMDSSLAVKVPINFIRQYYMVPSRQIGSHYQVAVNDPVNLLPLDDLRMLLGAPVVPVLCRRNVVQRVIDTYFDQQGENAAAMIDNITYAGDDDTEILNLDIVESERDLMDLANEAPIIKLINLLISGAVKERASDIHVEPFEREVRVRYRIDGMLYEKFTVPKSQQAAVVSRVKIMANLNIAEHRLPQDGRIKIRLSGKEIDIRVSVIPVAYGERVVMRILEKGSFSFGLEQIGMDPHDYNLLDKLIKSSHGIVLVTGPTCSGKSTTLYSVLQRVSSAEKNIITVEDPIEYQMPGIGQIQVHEKIGLTFAAGLRSILRQDPDIVLVGEIRDHETAEMAIQASLTGHLVFATLHTNDSASAITRLVNMGIEPFLVSSSTVAIMAQRLIRRLCEHCKVAYEPEVESVLELGVTAEEAYGRTVYKPGGCEKCLGRGYRGRMGIFEVLVMTPKIQKLTVSGADSNVLKREAKREAMRTLREDGASKVFQGFSTIEEVLRVTREDVEELAE